MAVAADTKITDSEWEVMRVVWANQEVTSKEIIDVLEQKKAWKPATTKTFIGRLVKKGMLNTKKDGNRYLYSTDVSEVAFVKAMFNDLFDNVCDRQKGDVVAYLLSQIRLSFADVEKITTILTEKETEAVDLVPCNCLPGQCHCKIIKEENDHEKN
ncbi:CopY/TcrY family copper transport repressor [Amphibacillus indicireducens]|uniref:CopY/TcrY family copper transport repressor n=1 Tax=Amphibacillus indicireducens TaxID=1076330 RepID=A0ABP7VW79_9BACI